MKAKIISVLLCVVFFASCEKDFDTDKDKDKDNDKDADTYTPTNNGTAKSWANDVKPIMDAYCVSCHSSYANYSSVSNAKGKIRSTIVSGSMPTSTTLTTEQKDIVVSWIDNGAPNN